MFQECSNNEAWEEYVYNLEEPTDDNTLTGGGGRKVILVLP